MPKTQELLPKTYAMKSTNTDQSKKIAQILFEIGAVTFSRKRPFKFDSGILSPVYVDNRYLISYPKERAVVLKALISLIKAKTGLFDVVAGVATAGIPHAAWIAQELNLPMIFVRSKPKEHGKSNQVEGRLKKGQRVLVVEDLISTAGSSARVIKAIRDKGGVVTDLIAIYSHNLKESKDNLEKIKVKAHYLTDTQTAANLSKNEGFLTQEQVDTILDWTRNPSGWGKKMGYE